MAGKMDEATEAHYRRVAALSLAIERGALPGKMEEILEIAEAVDRHFAWEPYAGGEESADPMAAAGLARLRIVQPEDLDRAIQSLPVFPLVAQRAMRVLMSDDWSGAELEKIASSDQTLASQLLTLANSWMSAARERISTIAHAITYIGAVRTRRILYAASVRPLFSRGPLQPLWQHSIAAAQAATTIAEITRSADPNQAFLAGLIHDIGRLAMAMLPASFQSRFERLTQAGCEPVLVERILSGFSHAQAGARALRMWNFPEPLIAAIEFHHEPEINESKLGAILFLVEQWADSQEDVPSAARLKFALDRVGMSESDLAQLVPKEDRSIDALRYT